MENKPYVPKVCSKCGGTEFTPVRKNWTFLMGRMTNKIDLVCNRCGKVDNNYTNIDLENIIEPEPLLDDVTFDGEISDDEIFDESFKEIEKENIYDKEDGYTKKVRYTVNFIMISIIVFIIGSMIFYLIYT